MSPLFWKGAEQLHQVLPFHELGLGGMDSLDGNQRDLLTSRKHLRNSIGDIVEERAECGQTLIPSSDVIVSVDFQMLKKPLDSLKGEILERNLRDSSPLVLGKVTEIEPHRVSIASNRCWL